MSILNDPYVRKPAIRWNSGDTLPSGEGQGRSMPLLVDDTTGRLLVDLPPYSDPNTTNGLLHAIEADIQAPLQIKLPGLNIEPYDYMSLSYTGSNLTGVVYKTGGSSGSTVATLALTYDGSGNLTEVTKS
jgi:hypothetical protein